MADNAFRCSRMEPPRNPHDTSHVNSKRQLGGEWTGEHELRVTSSASHADFLLAGWRWEYHDGTMEHVAFGSVVLSSRQRGCLVDFLPFSVRFLSFFTSAPGGLALSMRSINMNRLRMGSWRKTGLTTIGSLCIILGLLVPHARSAPPADGEGEVAHAMDRGKLLIGAYYLTDNLFDDQHVQEVADAGIDFLVAVDAKKEVLDLCQKHQIGLIASSNIPLWWGDDGKRAGQYRETFPLEKLDAIKRSYPFHPALWGDYPVDEPNVRDFTHINDVIARYNSLFPGKLAYINLYPNYANTAPQGIDPELQKAPSQLGTTSYQEYIDKYLELIDNDYICFDSYPFTGPFDNYLENLDIVGAACRRSGRDMWVIIQTGAWKSEAILGEFQLRWQAYLCLAYGSKIIMHASFCPGWWHESTSCVNKAGEKNVTYEYVRKVNSELHALSDVFMQYDNIGVAACGNISGASARMTNQLTAQTARNKARSETDLQHLLAGIEVDGAAIAGCFKHKTGDGHAIMLVNAQDPWDANAAINVRLTLQGDAYVHGKKTPLSDVQKLESGEGVFITFD